MIEDAGRTAIARLCPARSPWTWWRRDMVNTWWTPVRGHHRGRRRHPVIRKDGRWWAPPP